MAKEYIEREAAIKATCENCTEQNICGGSCDDTDRLRAIPTADVVEVKHGRWVDEHTYKQTMSGKTYDGFTYCSCCKSDFDFGHRAKYCEECGARMDLKDGDGE